MRIRNLLKRTEENQPAKIIAHRPRHQYVFGPHEFDIDNMQLKTGNQRAALTTAERKLLACFARHPNAPLSRDVLAAMLSSQMEGRSLDVAVTRLRQKIEPNPRQPIYLLTMRGVGWMLQLTTKAQIEFF